jgi:hypothetical protein
VGMYVGVDNCMFVVLGLSWCWHKGAHWSLLFVLVVLVVLCLFVMILYVCLKQHVCCFILVLYGFR